MECMHMETLICKVSFLTAFCSHFNLNILGTKRLPPFYVLKLSAYTVSSYLQLSLISFLTSGSGLTSTPSQLSIIN